MESSTPGAQVDMAVHMSNTNFDPFAQGLDAYNNDMTQTGAPDATTYPTDFMASTLQQQSVQDHAQPSHDRGYGNSDGEQQAIVPPPAPSLAVVANQSVDTKPLPLEQTSNQIKSEDGPAHYSTTDTFGEPGQTSAVSEMSLNLEEMKGYAQLVFPDGEYLVTSTEIMLGRDERAQQILKDQQRQQRKAEKEQLIQQARQQAAEFEALAALEQYKREPGAESADVRRGSSASSHLLEGRPAPGLPSTFSEAGGIVNYEGSVDGTKRKRLKRRDLLLSRSSSNSNSVAPASLHVYGAAATPWGSNEDDKSIFLPIHPFQIEDIRKISKEHLRIFYDSVEKHWKMEIKGNGAFVLNELYRETVTDPETGEEEIAPRHFKRGDTVILTHNSEILVTSLTFAFKLPQRQGLSTFDTDEDLEDGDALDNSHTRIDDLDDDSDLSDVNDDMKLDGEASATPKRPKILLKASKHRSADQDSPEPPVITGGKGKKKPADATESNEQTSPQQGAGHGDGSHPPVFDANSTLQHVPVNELPEKRKGPGRPPKNGLVSKRDEGIIRRKMKEYEKRGERPPPYKDILAIVRAENRAKELAARAAARGETMPPSQLEIMNAVPTTELDPSLETPEATLTDAMHTTDVANEQRATSQDPDTSDFIKNTMPQQQRSYKSPSPMKPKEEYTEEQLKRPTQTYYYILDEILSEGPEDAMELQQIYDKICKKYPFYKYVVESTGWQSSVRHNLKQNDRFKPVSKQGKGWLWAIDPAVPLDKEKKKKPTPPPMPRPPMQYQNGAIQQPYPSYTGQYGQQYGTGSTQYTAGAHQNTQQYGSTYGQAQSYVQHSQTTQQPVGSHAQPPPAVPRNLSHPPSRPASNTPQPGPQPGALPPAFQDLVEEIMRFRVEYLSPFGQNPAEYAKHERIFKRCVEWISQLHMRQNPEVKFENEEEKRVFQILETMRHKFEQGTTTAAKVQQQQPRQNVPGQTSAQPGQFPQAAPGQEVTSQIPHAEAQQPATQSMQQPGAVSGSLQLSSAQLSAVDPVAPGTHGVVSPSGVPAAGQPPAAAATVLAPGTPVVGPSSVNDTTASKETANSTQMAAAGGVKRTTEDEALEDAHNDKRVKH